MFKIENQNVLDLGYPTYTFATKSIRFLKLRYTYSTRINIAIRSPLTNSKRFWFLYYSVATTNYFHRNLLGFLGGTKMPLYIYSIYYTTLFFSIETRFVVVNDACIYIYTYFLKSHACIAIRNRLETGYRLYLKYVKITKFPLIFRKFVKERSLSSYLRSKSL